MTIRTTLAIPGWEVTSGQQSRTAKLTESQAQEILDAKGVQTAKQLASTYRVSEATVSDIWRRRRWKHLKPSNEQ